MMLVSFFVLHQTGTFRLVKKDGAARFTLDKATDNTAPPRPLPSAGVGAAREDMKEETGEQEGSAAGEGMATCASADDQLEPSEHGTDIPVGKRVKNAVKKIDDARVSVFSYAILSKQTEAVKLIFALVVKLFKPKTRMVRGVRRTRHAFTETSFVRNTPRDSNVGVSHSHLMVPFRRTSRCSLGISWLHPNPTDTPVPRI